MLGGAGLTDPLPHQAHVSQLSKRVPLFSRALPITEEGTGAARPGSLLDRDKRFQPWEGVGECQGRSQ